MLKASASTLLLVLPLFALADRVQGTPAPQEQKTPGQEEPQQETKQEKPSVLDEMDDMFGGDDAMQELVELFHEVERALVTIDDQLYEAGASGDLSEIDAAGLEKLLRSTKDTSSSVVQGIDRILEVASQMDSQQGSGSGQQQPSNSDSPLDSERDNGPMQRERTPEAPPQEKEGQGSEPKPEKEEGQKPDPKPDAEKDGEEPKGSEESRDRGQNKKGDPKQDAGGQQEPRTDDADRWGELPQRVRDTFRTQGRDELPAQYRDWIDAYYKRLNRTRS